MVASFLFVITLIGIFSILSRNAEGLSTNEEDMNPDDGDYPVSDEENPPDGKTLIQALCALLVIGIIIEIVFIIKEIVAIRREKSQR